MDLLYAHAEKIVVVPSGCHVWVGCRNGNGYGRVYVHGAGMCYTHRVAYEYARGEIPEGLVIDHLCRDRACCNPDHMEVVTNRENSLRGDTHAARNAAKTHCLKGHPLSGANLYVNPKGGRRWRYCRSCARARDRSYKARVRKKGKR